MPNYSGKKYYVIFFYQDCCISLSTFKNKYFDNFINIIL